MIELPNRVETRRLVLRQPVARDVPSIVRGLGRWNVARWLGRVPHPYTAMHARRWLAHVGATQGKGSDLVLAIALRSKPQDLVGAIGCHHLDGPRQVVGYWLAERVWGRGYASEAVAALIEEVLALKPDAAPVAAAIPDNHGSIAVLEKAGFRRELRREIHFNAARRRKVIVACFAHPGQKSATVTADSEKAQVR